MTTRTRSLRRTCPRLPRGSVYVIVLAIAMLVTVIGVGALVAVRVQLRAADLSADCEEARQAAHSGVELARLWIRQDYAWRKSRANGAWATGLAVGGGTFSVSVEDPADGDLLDDPLEPVVVTATGYRRNARQRVRVTLSPNPAALNSLDVAVAANGSIAGLNGTALCTRAITSNGNIATSGSGLVDADVEAVGSITGTNYLGSRVPGAAPRQMPDATDAFAYYVATGTSISYGSTNGQIRDVLISPNSNPFGVETNPAGIYVIDCGGQSIEIRNCRIVGTIVLLNVSGELRLAQVNWAPAVANLPALMVQGDVASEMDTAPAAENGTFNFNPSLTPFNGSWNATRGDTFPCEVNGLVYATGNFTIRRQTTIKGCLLVGGTLSWDSADLEVTYNGVYSANPPQGFFSPPPMVPLAGTWKQVVD